MTPEQLCELLNYIKKNNCWGDSMLDVMWNRNRKVVKYVDACFDSRDATVWNIKFRDVAGGNETEFCIESAEDLKKVYAWLDEPKKD